MPLKLQAHFDSIERDLIILEEVSFVVFHFSLISENAKPDISCEMCACTTDVC